MTPQPPIVRFCMLFEPDAHGCWVWIGRVQKHSRRAQNGGYPVFRIKDAAGQWRTVYAHRWIVEQCTGEPIPPGFEADHYICHNRPCVNPAHLRVIPKAANVAESNHRRSHRHELPQSA